MALNYLEFIEEIKTNIQAVLGGDAILSTKEITKNNGVTYIGLLIQKEEDNVIPTIYMESYYREYLKGKGVGEITNSVLALYEKSRHRDRMDMEFFNEYEKVKDKIAYKLVHLENNWELLQQVPYIPYLNLAIVFYYICEDEVFGRGTILIRKEHMDKWNIDVNGLYEQAEQNMVRLLPYEWKNMEQIIEEMMGKENYEREKNLWQDEGDSAMYVLTNCTKIFGAACILYRGLLEEIYQKLGRNFFILPSSVHEVIVIPQVGFESAQRLLHMVTEVNRTQVHDEEVLANSVYYYNKEKKRLEIVA